MAATSRTITEFTRVSEMKKIECVRCGDTVVLANEIGEKVTCGETPVEHLERTGHSPRQPTLRKCNDCGNIWPYSGSADRPTCPNCDRKDTQPIEELAADG